MAMIQAFEFMFAKEERSLC